MHPKKIYKNIDSVPHDEWNPIILALKQGEQAAEKLYRNVLDSIKEVKGNLHEKVRRFEYLKPNWDSYGAVPPSAVAIKNTLSFLEVLEVLQLTPDWVEPTSDDSIMLKVKVGDILQEWDFYSDGDVAVLYEKDGQAVECRMVEPKAWEMSRHVTLLANDAR
jgi:hypothetical protein